MSGKQLLPEQIKLLNDRLALLESDYKKMIEQKCQDSQAYNFSQDGFSNYDNLEFKYEVDRMLKNIRELRKILADGEEIKEIDSDVIIVGSRFTATILFEGEEETDNYILLDDHAFKETGVSVVTTSSPFGKAIIGKKANDNFSYSFNGIDINGHVDSINKAKVKTIK